MFIKFYYFRISKQIKGPVVKPVPTPLVFIAGSESKPIVW